MQNGDCALEYVHTWSLRAAIYLCISIGRRAGVLALGSWTPWVLDSWDILTPFVCGSRAILVSSSYLLG